MPKSTLNRKKRYKNCVISSDSPRKSTLRSFSRHSDLHNATAYPAPPLDDNTFRVLHLQPGRADDAIHFRLEISTFLDKSSSIEYEAISYAWGSSELSHKIYYDHEAIAHESSALMVTKSCYQALRSLRFPDASRTLWMDAVCINQTDIEERNAQVQIMGSIYSGARRVVVYLGESADDSDFVMKWVLGKNYAVDYPRRKLCIEYPSSMLIVKFTERSWFSRIWVLQEIANAREVNVMCGNLVIPWAAIETSFLRTLCTAVQLLGVVQEIRSSSDASFASKLLKLLHYTRSSSSSDERDRIYGLLPLMQTDTVPIALQPNYKIEPRQLFLDVARFVYSEMGPRILYHVSYFTDGRLPSWVPDWRPIWALSRNLGLKSKYEDARAGGEFSQLSMQGIIVDTSKPQDSNLRVKAICIGSISEIGPKFQDHSYYALRQNTIKAWKSLADKAEKQCTFGFKNVQASSEVLTRHIHRDIPQLTDFQRLIIHDGMGAQDLILANSEYIHEIVQILDNYIKWRDTVRGEYSLENRVRRHIYNCCLERRLAVLNTGMLALVPEHTELSDVIYVLHGASFPFVLRKHGNNYKLVGDCFVQGIMYGEAVDGVDVSSMETVILE